MLLEITISLITGIGIGIFTGITPGIHVNLVATTLLALSAFLLKITTPLSLGVFIMSLAVTHSFIDTLPSVYLGAPDDANALSVLPSQKMLLKGEAYQAVKITIMGAYSGLIVAICLVPLFIIIANTIYPLLKPYLAHLLVLIILYMLFRGENKFWNALVFLLSGALGVLVLSASNLKEPLFPLLSGLFGISGLLISFFENTNIPEQKISKDIDLKLSGIFKCLASSSIGVFLIQFFPGMGPAQGAVISGQLIKNIKDKEYLALVGAMGTMSVIFSLVTFYTLGKAKDGSIVALSKLIEVGLKEFLILLCAYLIAGSAAVFLVLFLAKKFSKLITTINYKALVIGIICFVATMALILDGWLGLLILIIAAAIGLIAPLKEVARSHAMGCLLLPVMLYLML